MKLIQRNEARIAGLKRYYTGIPCKFGHMSERWVVNARCIVCIKEWNITNKHKLKQINAEWYKSNTDKAKSTRLKYRSDNRNRINQLISKWAKENRGKKNHVQKKRELARKMRTPVWADQYEILKFYEESNRLTRMTGIEHHVDHIIPLQGDMVCGLHVENNLRVIPKNDNLSKGNKLIEDI